MKHVLSALLVAFYALAQTAHANNAADALANSSKTPSFMQLSKQGSTPTALQVALVRYRPRSGSDVTVDVIGAVHIGDKSYYAELNERFKNYDAVLYELVADDDHLDRINQQAKPKGVVSGVQRMLKNGLGLSFQLEEVDYLAPNLVHADLSPEEFSQSMDARGESMLGMFLKMIFGGMALQHQGKAAVSDYDLLKALMADDTEHAMKVLMARQFADPATAAMMFEGQGGSTLIGERNKAALEVLREQINAGKSNIAIFYGAGHMPDFERRLDQDFDMQPEAVIWIDAWDLSKDLTDPSSTATKP